MKHQTNKIKAFTLSEMIIVLILTAIVVGLAFTVLGLVQKHMLSIQKNYNTQTEVKKLETSLWLDFNRFSKIEFDNIENKLKFKTEIDSITYQFFDAKIIKHHLYGFNSVKKNVTAKIVLFKWKISKTRTN